MALFDKAIRGEALPRQIEVGHPKDRDSILVPDKRTTFGVVEMTTGCGRRCQFCVPDLNPQIDVPKDRIMARRPRERPRRQQADLARHRGHVHLGPGAHRDAVLLSRTARRCSISTRAIVNTPGVEQHVLSHATIAPSVVDPVLIEKLSELLPRQEPDPAAAAQHASGEARARAAHRPRDRIGAARPGRSCRARACRSRSTTGRASSSTG